MDIDEALEYTFDLSTNTGVPEALENMLSYHHYAEELYELLIGCDWDADAVAGRFNDHPDLMTVRDWYGKRTLPRMLALRGTDGFGNVHLLYIRLYDGEPDMMDSIPVLSLSLTNQSRVPLSISNIMAHDYNEEDLLDYLYEAFDYTAEGFAEAANNAWYKGVLSDGAWMPGYTRDDKCRIESRDSMGNKRFLVIRIS